VLAAGINDYASIAEDSITKTKKTIKSVYEVKPTFSHHFLTKLEEKGLLHYYIQQNHDGLPQKAGFPNYKINEIHGGWYDPSNPVVKFSGMLREDLLKSLNETEKKN